LNKFWGLPEGDIESLKNLQDISKIA